MASSFYDSGDGIHDNPFRDTFDDNDQPPPLASTVSTLSGTTGDDSVGGALSGSAYSGEVPWSTGSDSGAASHDNTFAESEEGHSQGHGAGQSQEGDDNTQQRNEHEQQRHEVRGAGEQAQTGPIQSGSQGESQGESQGASSSAQHGPRPEDPRQAPKGTPQKPVKKYKLSIKVTGLERQGRKDPIIRFDAHTNLPRFRTSTFRDVRRTHGEFVKFFDHLNGANPEVFVPSVPPATTSAGAGSDEDEAAVKANVQLWLDRVTANPILQRDEEFVYFVESDFGYTPMVKRRPPATGLARKAMKQLQPPPDDVAELAAFRPLIKRVYQTGTDATHKLERATKTQRALALAWTDLGARTAHMADSEQHGGMANMWLKLGKTLTHVGDLAMVKATAEMATFGDGVAWVAGDAYVAKEALTNRHILMRELSKAQATTRSRHQQAIRVKGSTSVSPLKVDEAIAALDEATHAEEALTNRLRRCSDNMLLEKNVLIDHIDQDLRRYINNYTLRVIECERRALSAWEAIRADVRAVDANGGLSRLGREATPALRRSALAQSQTPAGDAWTGDRVSRAHPRLQQPVPDDEPEDDDHETAVDARSAASLLAGSTF